MKFFYIQSFLPNFSAPAFFVCFLSTKIAINWSKFTPKSCLFFCEFLVPPELPAKFQRSSMTCEPPPPSVGLYVPPYVNLKKSFLLLLVLLSALVKIFGVSCMRDFFLLQRVLCSLKDFFLILGFFKKINFQLILKM